MKTFLKSFLVAALCIGLGTSTYTAVAQSIIGGGSGGSTSPGGSTTQVQYNNAGAFGGASGLTTTGSNLAINGCTIGSNALCATGTATFSGTLSTTGAIIAGAAQQIYWSTRTTLQAPSNGALQVGDNALSNSFTITAGAANLATFNGALSATNLTLSGLSASSAVCTDGSKVLTTSGCTSAFPTVVAAKNNADQSLSSTTTTVKISFQTEDVDNSSAFASSTFTAPATGCYRATYTLFFTGSPTRVITEFEVNGSPQFQIEQRTLALSVFNAHDDRIICISSGQTIEVWGAMQGTTPSVQGTGVGISSFSVQRVS